MVGIEVGISTVGRWDNLSVLLWSLLKQTCKYWDLTIIDDSKEKKDLRKIPSLDGLLKLIEEDGHSWRVFYGQNKGWHHAQQIVLDQSRHQLTWILDEDIILESKVLELLSEPFIRGIPSYLTDEIGATGGIFLLPGDKFRSVLPVDWKSREDYHGRVSFRDGKVGFGNSIQYIVHTEIAIRTHKEIISQPEPKETDHLIGGSVLYRTDVAKSWGFDLDFNYTARCSDDLFTYRFFKAGYKLLVIPQAIVWHLPSSSYGELDKNGEEYRRLCGENRSLFEIKVKELNGIL